MIQDMRKPMFTDDAGKLPKGTVVVGLSQKGLEGGVYFLFPAWMGPNIEPRHVFDMGWGVEPPPPVPARGPKVETRVSTRPAKVPPQRRVVVACKSGREFAVYVPASISGDEVLAWVRANKSCLTNEEVARWGSPAAGDDWLTEPRRATEVIDVKPDRERQKG